MLTAHVDDIHSQGLVIWVVVICVVKKPSTLDMPRPIETNERHMQLVNTMWTSRVGISGGVGAGVSIDINVRSNMAPVDWPNLRTGSPKSHLCEAGADQEVAKQIGF